MSRAAASSLAVALAAAALLAGCERPPMTSVQAGYRGTGMDQVANPRTLEQTVALNVAPPPLDPAPADGPKASQVFQNVKVLGDLSAAQFARTMVAMTAWVAPKEGCLHCHNPQNFADDSLYTKVVARRMLQMTQKINADWQPHVGKTGVTCYTCHRGNNVPAYVWFKPEASARGSDFLGDRAGQNAPATSVGLTSLPNDPFSEFLLSPAGSPAIRVQGTAPLPGGNLHSIKQAEYTYGLMVHMSSALGVNCTHCHNSRSFGSWEESSPPRLTAWHGIRMVRELNDGFMVPLTATFPARRLGAGGDVAKVNCETCHQGAFKPLLGAQMARYHPELLHVVPVAAPAASAASGAMPAASGTVALAGAGPRVIAALGTAAR